MKNLTSLILIEPFQHYEVLHSILRMVEKREESITVITNDFCKNHINFKDKNFITWYTSTNTEDTILAQQQLIQSTSKILFTTIDPASIFWKWEKPNTKIFAYVHNAHNFFDLNSYRVSTLFYQTKYQAYRLRGDYHQQQNILDQLAILLLPDTKVTTHIKSRIDSKYHDKIKKLPFAFPKYDPTIHQHEQINICVPGTIANKSRNYQLLAGCLQIVDQAIQTPVQLTLLGRLRAPSIQRLFEKINFQKIKIEIFSDYVSPDLFQERMLETDFLLLPLQEKLIYKAHFEYFGQSSVSGNINDLTQYALPAILPDFYPLESPLEELVARYQSEEELTQILIDWITNRTFNQLKKEGTTVLDEYQKKVLSSFSELFGKA